MIDKAVEGLISALLGAGPIGLLALAGWVAAVLSARLAVKSYNDRFEDNKVAQSSINAAHEIARKLAERVQVLEQLTAAGAEAQRTSNELRQREIELRQRELLMLEMTRNHVGRRNKDTAGG